ncbi:MAG: cytochrome c-type biogenesis protein CcmH [Chloroflexi bacterium]|nr:cytochrome c-type biogenesis protein CcmH [Chloroflexota bacterium]
MRGVELLVKRGPLLLLGCLALLLLLAASCAARPAPNLEEQARDIERSLICPICPTDTLDVADNQLSRDMKAVIRKKLAQGESKEQIIQYFVDRYGEGILTAPPRRGFNLLLYALPFAAVGAGAYLTWRLVHRASARRLNATPAQQSGEDAAKLAQYQDRVRKELEDYRR